MDAAAPPQPEAETRPLPWPRRRAILAPLILLLLLWLFVVAQAAMRAAGPHKVGLDGDFAIFYSASTVLQAHGNPYDHGQLYRAWSALIRHVGITSSTNPIWVLVGNPPLLFWAMEPITKVPFPIARWLWVAAMALCSSLGGLAVFAAAGWTRHVVPLLMFLAMPQVLLGYYVGNVSPLVFLGIALGLFYGRTYPFAAGVFLSLAWLKPSVALPLVMLIVLFHTISGKRATAGFGVATALLGIISFVVLGPESFVRWIHGLSAFSRNISSQPEIASLSALYVHHASTTLRTGLEVLFLTVAAGLTAWFWWTRRGTHVTIFDAAWLWFAWFLATPYAHINDAVMLAPPLVALLGTNGRNISSPLAALSLYLLFAGILAAPIHVLVGLESLELAGVGVCLAIASRQLRYRDGRLT